MNVALRAIVLLCGVLFIVTGLRWLLAPAGVAPEFGLVLSTGVGLSSQTVSYTHLRAHET